MTNRTLLQFFHWYTPGGGKLWGEVSEKAMSLGEMGITDVWLPPSYKGASGGASVGYDTYDLFDLGEFDQKGSVATKYGDRLGLERAAQCLRDAHIRVIHDVVFDHKMGADDKERVTVQRVKDDNRNEKDGDPFEALAYTRFTFPARQGKYSKFVWDRMCFSGVDYVEDPDATGVFRILNEYGDGEWNQDVDEENGNFDYLMGSDVEFRNNAVYEELKFWGRWFAGQVPCDGFRLDAAKHIPAWFFRDWVGHMRETVNSELFVVAEYWAPDMAALQSYLRRVDNQMMLFDSTLQNRFSEASKVGGDFDLRTIFDGSLVSAIPEKAVTLVANHDTQPLQALESPVDPWFKPIAYALILLREQGMPCVFHPDLYGATYTDKGRDGEDYDIDMPAIACLPKLIEARKRFANGPQTDLFDDPHAVAFVRHGTADAPGCIVVLANGPEAWKTVELGGDHAGTTFYDFLGHCEEEAVADGEGRVTVRVNGGSVSVWVPTEA